MGLSTFLVPVAADEPALSALRQWAASLSADDVGDEVGIDEEEWERSDVGRATTWLLEHPERVEMFRFAPDVACALGETSDEVWVWTEGAEMLAQKPSSCISNRSQPVASLS